MLDFFRRKKESRLAVVRAHEQMNALEGFISRSFEAATKIDNPEIWRMSGSENYNQDVRQYFEKILRVSRFLAKNNDLVKGILREIAVNVVGAQGFRITPRFRDHRGKLLERENYDIKYHWNRWGNKRFCDRRGKRSSYQMIYTLFYSMMRDGGALAELIDDDSEYGFSMNLLPIELLDINLNTELKNGNYVSMGIELDSYGKPLFYYLHSDGIFSPGTYTHHTGLKYRKVPAENMIHHFWSEYPEAVREVSWLVASAVRITKINSMDSAILKASILAASKLAFGLADEKGGGSGSYGYSGRNKKIPKGEGMIPVLTGLKDIKMFNPDVPKDTYPPFLKAQNRAIATGMGVSYNNVGNDIENVSYSGLRHRQNQDEDYWETLQEFVISDVMRPLYERFLMRSALKRKFNSPRINRNFWEFENVDFIGRKFKPIDSLKAAKTAATEISNLLKSRHTVSNERGHDYEEELPQIISELLNLKKERALPSEADGKGDPDDEN